jgi:hypothetical protein
MKKLKQPSLIFTVNDQFNKQPIYFLKGIKHE